MLAEGEELDEWPDMPGMPKRQGPRGTMQEKDMKLSDVFDEEGSYRSLVEKDGEVIPLIYLYDFGVGGLARALVCLADAGSRTTGSTSSLLKARRWRAPTALFSPKP